MFQPLYLLIKGAPTGDFEKTKISLTIAFAIVGIVISISYWIIHPFVHLNAPRVIYIGLPILLALTYPLYKAGVHAKWVGIWVIFSYYITITTGSFFSGGIYSIILPWLAILPVLATLILRYNYAFFWLALCAFTLLAMVVLQPYSVAVQHVEGPWRSLLSVFGLCLILFLCTGLFDRVRYKLMLDLQRVNRDLREHQVVISDRNEVLEKYWHSILEVSKDPNIYSGNWKGALDRILEVAMKKLDVDRASIWLYHRDRECIECVSICTRNDQVTSRIGEIVRHDDNPPYFRAIKSESVIVAPDVHQHPDTKLFSALYFRTHVTASLLDVPFFFDQELAGILCCETEHVSKDWTSEDILFSVSLGEIISLAHRAEIRTLYERKISEQNQVLLEQQEEIRKINANLESRVEERTRALLVKNLQLEEYAYINSHLVRAPLARVIGLTNLILNDHPNVSDELLAKLKDASVELDSVVRKINKAIEEGNNFSRQDL